MTAHRGEPGTDLGGGVADLEQQLREIAAERDEALERQTATAEILKVIASSPSDVQPVFNAIAERSKRLVDALSTTVFRLEDGMMHLRAFTPTGPEADTSLKAMFPAALSNFSWSEAIGRGEIYRVVDTDLEIESLRELARLRGFRSMLFVPLLSDRTPIGLIAVTRADPGPFVEHHVQLLQTFADQAVIAIENVRLFDEVQARTAELSDSLQQQTATADVLKVISRSTFDLQAVFDTLVTSATQLCGADAGNIWLRKNDLFYCSAAAGFTPEQVAFFRDNPRSIHDKSLAPRVLRSRQTEHIPDLSLDPEFAFPGMSDLPSSMLGVPLLRNDVVEGVFTLLRAKLAPFTSRQIELVESFADQAVIAIENVRLFDEVQSRTEDLRESLQQQTATADVLKVISRSTFDLKAVLATLVQSARELCNAPQGMVLLRDGEVYRTKMQLGYPPDFERYILDNPIHPNAHSGAGRAAFTGQVVHFPDVLADPEYRLSEGQRLGGYRTMLSVPLLREKEVIGVFSLGRTEPDPFTDRQIELVQTFADQAVIAIENVRLFDEVQARTEDLRESLQQQTATADVLKVISRSTFDLQAVLDTLVASAARLCEADKGVIFKRDGELYRWSANFGNPPELEEFAKVHPFTPGRYAVTPRVALEGRTFHVVDVLADPDYSASEYQKLGGYRTILGVPLLREGMPMGVFALTRDKVKPFTDKQIELVQTFADQAVIAIENVRLFDEVQSRTKELAASLEDLRTAQDRLVQTEKLASLGQLTAGIAHEIKNPLNFVNNFAALSAELTDELNDVLRPAALADKMREEIDELTGMLKSNLEKVVQHGKRADSIVKNMLLHSREGSGDHRPADINALLDESLNLAYHGARAERPEFNVTLQRDFDDSAGMVELFPQEITRAFLNLISNGFYATAKRKTESEPPGFEPMLRATTKNIGNGVEIRIRDNGTGIPAEVKEKMFNPFFTTKPAGEGTGLGLSMSHDIIVKQHGGTIDVDTQAGQFTEFKIFLPRTSSVQNKKQGQA